MTAETLARTGPLPAWAGLPETVRVEPRPFVAMADLRLDPTRILGLDLPTVASTWVGTDEVRAIWLGPDEWLVTSTVWTPRELEAGLRDAVAGRGAVVDVSGQRTTVRLSGEHARDVLSGGCSLDLHPRVFRPGSAAQTALGRTGVVLVALEDGYDILVRSSFAGYLAAWLHDAAAEHR